MILKGAIDDRARFLRFRFSQAGSRWCSPPMLNPGDSDPRPPGAECLPGRSPRLIPVPAEQHLLERLSEHLVEDGVEDGVHHGAGVA